MDPNACLREILEAVADGDREVAEKLRDLADWIESGGFMPDCEAVAVSASDVGSFIQAVMHDIDLARRDKP